MGWMSVLMVYAFGITFQAETLALLSLIGKAALVIGAIALAHCTGEGIRQALIGE